jgi:endo-1,4-beta-xylanase
MKFIKPLFLLSVSTILLLSCNNKITRNNTTKNSLKKTLKGDFYIGTAINESQILEKNAAEEKLITDEFNSITPENIMKSMFVQPTKGNFQFDLTDKYVAYGEKHNMFIHGHTLICHSQLAPWMSEIKDGNDMKTFMKSHINTVVSRYKGRINSWDVVNEALNEDGTLRKSIFLKTLGESFLIDAFKLAASADSKVDLYYNDYNLCEPAKRAGAVKLIKTLQENGAKIDGIGMQGHWQLDKPSLEEIEKSIVTYSELGIKVAITELDITVLQNPWDIVGADVNQKAASSEKMNPYPKSLPDSIQNKLAERYNAIFKLFLKHKDKISRVTLWGAHDGQSWLNDWPIEGRSNYPLPFDRNLQPKKAYFSIIEAKNKQ